MVSTRSTLAAMLAVAATTRLGDHSVAAQQFAAVTFFQHGGYRGQSLRTVVTADQCFTMPCFDKKVSSFQHETLPSETRRVRLQLYASANCSGAKLIDDLLPAGTGGRDSLPKDVNDMVSSFRVARVTPSPDWYPQPLNACVSTYGNVQCVPKQVL